MRTCVYKFEMNLMNINYPKAFLGMSLLLFLFNFFINDFGSFIFILYAHVCNNILWIFFSNMNCMLTYEIWFDKKKLE